MIRLSKQDEHLRSKAVFDESVGYHRIRVDGKTYLLHRYITKAKPGEIVDHRDRDKTNYTRSNLRIVNKKLNNYNRDVKNKLGRGIYYDRYGDRYRACISHNNKTLKLGSFKCINEAKKAYNKKSLEIYGEDAFQHPM